MRLICESWWFERVYLGGSPREMVVQEASDLLSWSVSLLKISVEIWGCTCISVCLAESDSYRIIITQLSHRLQVFLWLLLKWLFQELFYGFNHQMSHYHPALFLLIRRKWQYKSIQDVRIGWFIVLTQSWFWELIWVQCFNYIFHSSQTI